MKLRPGVLLKLRRASAAIACTLVVAACGADRSSATIGSGELQDEPPIAIVWAESRRARHTASGDLYVVRADRAVSRKVRAWPRRFSNGHPYGTGRAEWSPDRKHLGLRLSVWNGDPDGQAAVVSSDGRRLRTLSKSHWTVGHVAWSPDGSALLYSYLNGLWMFTPRTGKTKRIWHATVEAAIRGAAWSPDGRKLTVATPEGGLVTMARNGRNVVALTHGDDSSPQWSPDGRQIAFYRNEGIFVIRTNGKDIHRVASGFPVAWSPDSRSILFTGGTATGSVYTVGADGRKLRRLTSGASARAVAWSADGSMIFFVRQVSDENKPNVTWSELWVMDADGGRQTRLSFNRPGWSVLSADLGS